MNRVGVFSQFVIVAGLKSSAFTKTDNSNPRVRFQKIAYFIGVYKTVVRLSMFVPFSRTIFLRRSLNKKRNRCNSFY